MQHCLRITVCVRNIVKRVKASIRHIIPSVSNAISGELNAIILLRFEYMLAIILRKS